MGSDVLAFLWLVPLGVSAIFPGRQSLVLLFLPARPSSNGLEVRGSPLLPPPARETLIPLQGLPSPCQCGRRCPTGHTDRPSPASSSSHVSGSVFQVGVTYRAVSTPSPTHTPDSEKGAALSQRSACFPLTVPYPTSSPPARPPRLTVFQLWPGSHCLLASREVL